MTDDDSDDLILSSLAIGCVVLIGLFSLGVCCVVFAIAWRLIA